MRKVIALVIIFLMNVQFVVYGNNDLLPATTPFYDILRCTIDVAEIDEIKFGVIVNNTDKRCADIEYDDLRKWLDIYWNFDYYNRVVAPLSAFDVSGNYVKLWNADKSKSCIVYSNGGVIIGKFGQSYESHGEVKQNYIWYLPAIGNSRNALNIADMTLNSAYFTNSEDIGFKGYMQRNYTSNDDVEIPQKDYLMVDNASQWSMPEIEKATACNLMIYELSDKYNKPITRYEFCKLAYRLIATEFNPNTDSRMGIGLTIQNVLTERGIADININNFSDCDFTEVIALASMGIIQGMGNGTFLPDSYITREQAAAILYRTAEFLGNKTIINPQFEKLYDDENQISEWAKSSVGSMKAMNIMKGIYEKEFDPNKT